MRNRYLRLQKKKQVGVDPAAAGAVGAEEGGELSPGKESELTQSFKKGEMWTEEEDALIMKAMMTYGQNWKAVSERVPGRSAHAVRNRFLRELRTSTLRLRQQQQQQQHQQQQEMLMT